MLAQFLENTYVGILVSILTSIIGSVLLVKVQKTFKKGNSRKISNADKLVLKWLQDRLRQKEELPKAEVYLQLLLSAAHRHEVDVSELRSLEETVDQLILEALEDEGAVKEKDGVCLQAMSWRDSLLSDRIYSRRKRLVERQKYEPLTTLGFAIILFQISFVLGIIGRSGQFEENYLLVAVSIIVTPVAIGLVGSLALQFFGWGGSARDLEGGFTPASTPPADP